MGSSIRTTGAALSEAVSPNDNAIDSAKNQSAPKTAKTNNRNFELEPSNDNKLCQTIKQAKNQSLDAKPAATNPSSASADTPANLGATAIIPAGFRVPSTLDALERSSKVSEAGQLEISGQTLNLDNPSIKRILKITRYEDAKEPDQYGNAYYTIWVTLELNAPETAATGGLESQQSGGTGGSERVSKIWLQAPPTAHAHPQDPDDANARSRAAKEPEPQTQRTTNPPNEPLPEVPLVRTLKKTATASTWTEAPGLTEPEVDTPQTRPHSEASSGQRPNPESGSAAPLTSPGAAKNGAPPTTAPGKNNSKPLADPPTLIDALLSFYSAPPEERPAHDPNKNPELRNFLGQQASDSANTTRVRRALNAARFKL